MIVELLIPTKILLLMWRDNVGINIIYNINFPIK
jgi:hypothetical protein